MIQTKMLQNPSQPITEREFFTIEKNNAKYQSNQSQGECTGADDAGSSVECSAGVYTCLIARTSKEFL